ncbi:MAG: LuxR C-terminal-related transcriptional regulator [Coriobacteriia bacterium]
MRSRTVKPAADRIGDVRSVIEFVRHNPLASMSLSLLFLWTWIYFQDSFLYAPARLSVASISMPWAIVVLSFIAVFFTMGFVSRRMDFSFQNGKLISVAAVAMCAGALMLHFGAGAADGIRTTLFVFGLIVLGGTTPVIYVEIVRLFLNFGFKSMLFSSIIAVVFSVTFYAVLSRVPFAICVAATLCLPPLMAICLCRSFRRYGVIEPAPRIVEDHAYVPWRLVLTSLFQGMAFGSAQAYLLHMQPAEKTALGIGASLAGFLCAAVIMLMVTIFLRTDFNSLIYKIGFVLLSFGLLFISIGQTRVLGFFLNALGYRFIDCLIWALVIYLTHTRRVSLNWIMAWPTAALYFGMAVGLTLVANTSSGFLGLSAGQLFSVFAVVVLTSAIVFTSARNVAEGWGAVRITARVSDRGFSQRALELVQSRYELSPRQREVFSLIAKGCTRREISDQLYLSEETVKVHVHNIYKKTDVHSRQELLGLIEAEESLLEDYDPEFASSPR